LNSFFEYFFAFQRTLLITTYNAQHHQHRFSAAINENHEEKNHMLTTIAAFLHQSSTLSESGGNKKACVNASDPGREGGALLRLWEPVHALLANH
jgi:hypothetical protein